MTTLYFKRYRMEIDLDERRNGPASPRWLPPHYGWVAWSDDHLARHADVKFQCFVQEIDTAVFPGLGRAEGCLRIMREIRRKPGFLPGATWLIAGPGGDCGTIQGVIDAGRVGAIQNVGIVPEHRGRGLGSALVRKALEGFRQAGLTRATLEVTAENAGAVRLYRALGFRKVKTSYKAVDVPGPMPLTAR
jgi:ribosomal protein S18 acetylase RimI-like enzyme